MIVPEIVLSPPTPLSFLLHTRISVLSALGLPVFVSLLIHGDLLYLPSLSRQNATAKAHLRKIRVQQNNHQH
jgi:hypothetical protein